MRRVRETADVHAECFFLLVSLLETVVFLT